MKLKSLSLTNFRGFERLDMEFHERVNVIAGINGVGKSSVLQALRILLSRGLPEITGITIPGIGFTDDDVQEGRETALVSCVLEKGAEAYLMNAQRKDSENVADFKKELLNVENQIDETEESLLVEEFSNRFAYIVMLEKLKIRRRTLEAKLRQEKVDWSFINSLRSQQDLSQKRFRSKLNSESNPLAIYFSANRQVPFESRNDNLNHAFDTKIAYRNSLDDRAVSIREFIVWYEAQLYLTSEGDLGRKRNLGKVLQAADEFAGISELRLTEERKPQLQVRKEKTWLAIKQLSDGERASLALVFDLARRLTLANPGLDDPLEQGEAVVLIDEIELHLHPRWQRNVMENLSKTFPACQFIVTSHSPQVIGEVENDSVRFLEKDGTGGMMCWTPDQTIGLDANMILDLMGADSINEEIRAEIQAAGELVEVEDFAGARAKLAQIKAQINGTNPDMVRLEATMRFLETPLEISVEIPHDSD